MKFATATGIAIAAAIAGYAAYSGSSSTELFFFETTVYNDGLPEAKFPN